MPTTKSKSIYGVVSATTLFSLNELNHFVKWYDNQKKSLEIGEKPGNKTH